MADVAVCKCQRHRQSIIEVLNFRGVDVCVERNGAFIRVDDVPAEQAAMVLADILESFRVLAKKYAEVIPDLDPVPGGSATDVIDDEWADEGKRKRRVGF